LWRKQRERELSLEQTRTLVEEFEWDWSEGRFSIVVLDAPILSGAARAVARYPLRAYDGVQLSSAIAARQADPDLRTFATFDGQLAAAATAEGFSTGDF
jgi:predicted nucleic acid-binding protein